MKMISTREVNKVLENVRISSFLSATIQYQLTKINALMSCDNN